MLDANKLGALGMMISDRLDDALDDLSPSAAAVLSMLHFKPELTTTDLARIDGVSQPTAVRLIDGLERRGLIARGKTVGRTTPLSLTAEGKARAVQLQDRRLAALDGLLAALSPQDRRRFEVMLDTVLGAATTSRAFARTTCRLCEHDLCAPGLCPIGARAEALERRALETRRGSEGESE